MVFNVPVFSAFFEAFLVTLCKFRHHNKTTCNRIIYRFIQSFKRTNYWNNFSTIISFVPRLSFTSSRNIELKKKFQFKGIKRHYIGDFVLLVVGGEGNNFAKKQTMSMSLCRWLIEVFLLWSITNVPKCFLTCSSLDPQPSNTKSEYGQVQFE